MIILVTFRDGKRSNKGPFSGALEGLGPSWAGFGPKMGFLVKFQGRLGPSCRSSFAFLGAWAVEGVDRLILCGFRILGSTSVIFDRLVRFLAIRNKVTAIAGTLFLGICRNPRFQDLGFGWNLWPFQARSGQNGGFGQILAIFGHFLGQIWSISGISCAGLWGRDLVKKASPCGVRGEGLVRR